MLLQPHYDFSHFVNILVFDLDALGGTALLDRGPVYFVHTVRFQALELFNEHIFGFFQFEAILA